MTYPISHLRPDYFLAREIRKKVNLAVSCWLCSGVLESVTWQCDRVLRRVKMASESVLLMVHVHLRAVLLCEAFFFNTWQSQLKKASLVSCVSW